MQLRAILSVLLLMPLCLPIAALAKQPQSSAEIALRTMNKELIAAKDLDLKTSFRITDPILGQSSNGNVHYILRQPNLMRVTAKTKNGQFVVVSDGKVLTLHEPDRRRYQQMPADDSIVGNLYLAAGLIGVEIRMVDFFWSVDYLATGGDYGRVSKLDQRSFRGKTCDGFKVERGEDAWSVWLDRSATRLPCHLISKRKDGSAFVTQTNTLTWKFAPETPESTFSFSAPKGHRKE
jgi:hypothetical protein